MKHEIPTVVALPKHGELLTPDDNAPDTALVAGTRKLLFVMFKLLGLPDIPSQEAIDSHIREVSEQ